MVGFTRCSLMYSPLSISDLSTAKRVQGQLQRRANQSPVVLASSLGLLLLVLHAFLQVSPHQPLPCHTPLTLDPHPLIQQLGRFFPRLDVQQAIQTLDDDNAMVRFDWVWTGLRIFERVGEGAEGDGGKRRGSSERADERDVGGRIEGEGCTSATAGFRGVLR